MQRRTGMIGRVSFIMSFRAEFYQSRGKIASGVTNPVLAAKARLKTAFAAGIIEIKMFFNCFLVLTQNYLAAVAVYSTRHFRDDQKRQVCTDPRNPRWF
jgi:hypothetical protein